ncbi:MAG: undecaprenyl-diphosphate phosphatase [Oscillospiraceae bacterium]|nr:undecaprenyl-diphosphate phosphatase [Oscillospiraceae bacterium]
MEYITILIQAIVQGLTEFIPVSSSGHLSVAQHFMSIEDHGLTISIVLHAGTLVSIFIAFRQAVYGIIREFFLSIVDIFTLKFSWSDMNDDRRMLFMVIIGTACLIPASFFSSFFTAPIGDGDIIFEGVAFTFTAMLLFLADTCVKGIKQGSDMRVKDALLVGFFQVVALFPGISRSGSTISVGLFRGLSRKTAVTFSFLLGIPAIAGGTLLEGIELAQAYRDGVSDSLNWGALTLGFFVAMIVGLMAIKLVKYVVKKEKFKIFAIYVMTLGILCVIWGVFENITGITVRL